MTGSSKTGHWAAQAGPGLRNLEDVFTLEWVSHPFEAAINNLNVAISHLKSMDIDSRSLDGARKATPGQGALGKGRHSVTSHRSSLGSKKACPKLIS